MDDMILEMLAKTEWDTWNAVVWPVQEREGRWLEDLRRHTPRRPHLAGARIGARHLGRELQVLGVLLHSWAATEPAERPPAPAGR